MVCLIVLVTHGGRFWEIGDPNSIGEHKPVELPRWDAGQWFDSAVEDGYYQTGQVPQLGAVICFSDHSEEVCILSGFDSHGGFACHDQRLRPLTVYSVRRRHCHSCVSTSPQMVVTEY